MSAGLTAPQLARYAVTQSIEASRRDGLTREGIDRAYLIGRRDYRMAGGREAVLEALRALGPASEITTEHGDTEFWGRTTDPYDTYRVVVVAIEAGEV